MSTCFGRSDLWDRLCSQTLITIGRCIQGNQVTLVQPKDLGSSCAESLYPIPLWFLEWRIGIPHSMAL